MSLSTLKKLRSNSWISIKSWNLNNSSRFSLSATMMFANGPNFVLGALTPFHVFLIWAFWALITKQVESICLCNKLENYCWSFHINAVYCTFIMHLNNKFSVMGTDGQPVLLPLVLLKQTCWLLAFLRECPFKCCKPASYKQLFGEECWGDHMQLKQGPYQK